MPQAAQPQATELQSPPLQSPPPQTTPTRIPRSPLTLVAAALGGVAFAALLAFGIPSLLHGQTHADPAANTPAADASAANEPATSEPASAQAPTLELPEGTTPWGGENFTFGADGNLVRIPCTYRDFCASSGLELQNPEYSVDPERNPADDGDDYENFSTLYLPGTNNSAGVQMHVASYRLDDDGQTHVYIKKDGQHVFEHDRYGDCTAFMVYSDYQSWDDLEVVSRYTFAGGIKLGMSEDEVYTALGEPAATRDYMDGTNSLWRDGDQYVSVCFDSRGAWIIEMGYNPEFVGWE